MSEPLVQNIFILEKPRVAILTDIIKVVNIFIKTILKDPKYIKMIRTYALKCNIYIS